MTKSASKPAYKLLARTGMMTVLLCGSLIGLAHAKEQKKYDLPEQSLAEALNSFASRNKLNIMFDPKLVKGKKTIGLKGIYTDQEALKKLLGENGLTYRLDDKIYYIRKAGSGKKPKQNPGDLAMMVQAGQGGVAPSQVTSDGGTGIVSGHVTVADTGGKLAGAIVRIVETGQTTKTDDRGMFRFSSVTPGDYTIFISFLGYTSRASEISLGGGEDLDVEFSLGRADGPLDEIVVFGSRSARAMALNLQRTAENSSDVLSADDLGNFTGTTFAEALRRVPGLAFQRDSVTGDGANIIVRGLEPDMNAVKLNGLHLPVSNGTGRSADLSNLLADSVSKITIHKSLLPSHDSAGTGALVEIETKSPLSRPHRYGNFKMEGGRRAKDFSDDLLLSGTLAGTFGAEENFGLSASVQYRDRSVRNIAYSIPTTTMRFGEYLPLREDGVTPAGSLDQVHPFDNFPFTGGGTDVYPTRVQTNTSHVNIETLALTLSGEWQVDDHTNLRLDVTRSRSQRESYSLGDTFQVDGSYVLRPVNALGGEERYTLDLLYDEVGDPVSDNIIRRQSYSYSPKAEDVTETYSFKGQTNYEKWEFNYLAGYAVGRRHSPRTLGLNIGVPSGNLDENVIFLPSATDAVEGRIISVFPARTGSGLPLPLLTEEGWAVFNDPANYYVANGSSRYSDIKGRNSSYTASFSAKYDFDQKYLQYIEVGAYYQKDRATNYTENVEIRGNASLVSLGLGFQGSDLHRIGFNQPGFDVVSEAALKDFADNIAAIAEVHPTLSLDPEDPVEGKRDQYTEEESIAGYLQARVDIGKLEIIGGARLNRVKTAVNNLYAPFYLATLLPPLPPIPVPDVDFQNEFSTLVSQSKTITNILPRILFNYRENDNLVFRGGYFLSVARPQIQQLSSRTSIRYLNFIIGSTPAGPRTLLEINAGNPGLKPTTTHNFDLSVEYYHDQIGVMKLSGFYKHIKNFLQTNVTNGISSIENVVFPDHPYFQGGVFLTSPQLVTFFDPDDPLAETGPFLTGSIPVNSDHAASIWGIEGHVERQFTFLPGFWNGFGAYANYTFTKSSKYEVYAWSYGTSGETENFEFASVPFNQQPKHTGTVALTYNKHDIDATLAYSFQSRRRSKFAPRGLTQFNEDVGTLDLRVEYYFDIGSANYRVYLEGSDLLKGTSRPDLEGTIGGVGSTSKYYTNATYLGGREFRVGFSANF